MLYHKFMVYRVRSRSWSRGMAYRSQQPRSLRGLATVVGTASVLGVSGLSFGVLDAHALLSGRDQQEIVWEFGEEASFGSQSPLSQDAKEILADVAKMRGKLSTAQDLLIEGSDYLSETAPVAGSHSSDTKDKESTWSRISDSADSNTFPSQPQHLGLSRELVAAVELPTLESVVRPDGTRALGETETEVVPSISPQQLARSLAQSPTSQESDVDRSESAERLLAEIAKQQGVVDLETGDAPSESTERDLASRWVEQRVGEGDSLSVMFERMGISAKLMHDILSSGKEARSLSRLNPGELLRVQLDGDGTLEKLVLERNALRSLEVVASKDGFEASLASKPVETRQSQITGVITDSLYQSAKRLKMSDAMIMELTEIFGWDVDFALDIKRGDNFAVLYEERYVDGKKFGNGNILAAEFVNQGKVFRAVRFENAEGDGEFYTPEGKSMRKAFLRAPVDFRRISSKFSPERYHPVLGKKRPHRGVDYAAATGTPIRAAGSGKISFQGKKGGYGRTVIIDHDGKHTTLYAHMSKYRKGLKSGSRVKQGDIIGYVGKSGLATGPHLHYEFRISGVHVDPLKVKLTKVVELPAKSRDQFAAATAPLIAQLNNISATRLASAE